MGIPENGKECLTQAAQLFDKKEYTKALAQIDLCLAQNPNDSEARLMKIQVLASQNQFDTAAALLADWIINGDDKELWLKTLHLLTYTGLSYKKALQTLASIEKNPIKSAALALYQADFALRDSNQKQALGYLEKAEKMVKDATTKMHIALQKAIIYYDQQNWSQAQKTLEEAHALDKNYPPANNLLAYIYAHNTDDLPKAISLINQALAKDPHNPHFLDTKALILYNQNDFDQAAQLLQKAAQACPTDFTILNHLGKCQFKKGNTSLALQSMKAAAAVAKNDQEKLKANTLIASWSKE
jgi:tetratricopeptide (TPR) repeat protein